MDKNQLDSMKIAELRELAESSNVEGFESMKKVDLIDSILKTSSIENDKDEKPKRKRTRKRIVIDSDNSKLEDKTDSNNIESNDKENISHLNTDKKRFHNS